MSEIFISYANEDRPTAQRIARALEAQGWSVWWDRKISPGRSFDEVIGEALAAAKCIIVLWSGTSVESNWVKEEAEEGNRRKILVPALIADVPIPLGFRRIQAANLVGWKGSAEDPEFQEFRGSIARLLGNETIEPKEPPAGDAKQPAPAAPSRAGAMAGRPSAKRSPWRWVACGATLIGGFVAGWGVLRIRELELSGAVPIWLLGLWLTWIVWRRLR